MIEQSSFSHLPLNALRAFEASARHLNFTRAAKELNVTQGAVSRQIALLEDQLQVTLFRRLYRRLSLTSQGQTLFAPLNQALKSISQAVDSLKHQTRDLSLKVHPTFAIRWLIPRLHKFQTSFPDIQVRFTTSNMNADFKYEHFDLAITYRGKKTSGVKRIKILEEQLTPVCSPRLLETDSPLKVKKDLIHHRLLHNSHDQREWRAWADQTGTRGLSFEKGQFFEIDDAALQAATAGLGIALGDRLLVKEDLISGRLVEPFEYTKVKTGSYYFTWPDRYSEKPGLMEFKDWLIREISPK